MNPQYGRCDNCEVKDSYSCPFYAFELEHVDNIDAAQEMFHIEKAKYVIEYKGERCKAYR